jgi:two-component system chemotaxis sensor kinase CheA
MLEQVLDKIRNKKLALSADVVSVLLEGTKMLSSLFAGVRDAGGTEPQTDMAGLTEKITKVLDSENTILAEIIDELTRINAAHELREIEQLIQYVSSAFDKKQQSDHTTSVSSQKHIPEIQEVQEFFARRAEAKMLDQKESRWVGEKIQELSDNYKWTEAGKDALEGLQEDYATCIATVGLDPLMRDMLGEKFETLDSEKLLIQNGSAVGPGQGETKKDHHTASAEKTMRVKESTVDTFLSFVGELVIVEEMYNNFNDQIVDTGLSRDELRMRHRKITENFRGFSRMLQNSIMDIRKVSLGKLLKRMPTIVREIAGKSGKKITTSLINEDLSVDKTLLERIDAPLVHMVRNAADHGIETPEEREEAGKSPEGHITLEAAEDGDMVNLIVRDDGAGIHTENIRKKAVSMGLLGENDPVTRDDILTVMFSSGVSTAETVTDVSGRGVGMDVVKDSIEKSGGTITVDTTPGKGSVFTISIPASVTTQIIQGLVVTVKKERYIFPVTAIVTSLKYEDAHIKSVKNQAHMMPLGNEMVRVRNLSEIVRSDADTTPEFIVVAESSRGGKLAVAVDAIIGIRQIVLKDIGEAQQPSFVAGGAVMGDETVALVLDIDTIC